MLAVRAALDELTLAEATASTARRSTSTARAGTSARSPTTPASCRPRQGQLAGTGIGTFNDRLRDAVRGGGPFDEDPRDPGLRHRAVHRPERRAGQRHAPPSSALGCCTTRTWSSSASPATCATTSSSTATGDGRARRRGRLQRPAGRLRRPTRARSITYVDAHDNETLFDALGVQAADRHADGRPGADEHAVAGDGRARRRAPSFWHAGTDLLRSKSLDRNSYDSGDWFNRIDWTGQEQRFGSRPAAGGRQRGQVAVSCGRCWPTRR